MIAPALLFVDPRVRVRDALRMLVRRDPAWAEPSLTIFRNRLLDETGSDARPLADLLLDALSRGLPLRTGDTPLDTATWESMIAPVILRWSAERFVQPDMARWAVECWGYAFGMIGAEQLRIAAPVRPPVVTPVVIPRTSAKPAATPAATQSATRVVPPSSAPRPRGHTATPPPVRSTTRTTSTFTAAPAANAWKSASQQFTPRGRVTHVNPWISRVLFVGLVAMGVGLVSYVSVASDAGAAPLRTAPAAVHADAPRSLPMATLPRPGVPSLTRTVADSARADTGRMLFVEPVRRASGTSRPMVLAQAGGAVALDEMRFIDGTRMRGRVEIVRAGTVIFRDVRTGLRHEVNKDDVSEIITEFGTSVRFSDTPVRAAPVHDGRVAGPQDEAARMASRIADRTSVRARGVSGRYLVRYEAASATGSPECTSVWQRAPDAVDRATVVHRAGADTLVLAFEGGDTFPSNIDREGRFASTFRIVPDQARSSTALTTRLTGQFDGSGTLALTVNIIFFRRMRAGGDLACNVTVNAVGRRE